MKRLDKATQEKVYKPSEDEKYNVEIQFKDQPGSQLEELPTEPDFEIERIEE